MRRPKGTLVASKSPLQKLQNVVVGSAGKAVQTARGGLALGRTVAGQVTRTAIARATGPGKAPTPTADPAPATERDVVVTPATVARVVEKKSPAEKAAAEKAAAKKAAAKKAPAKKASSPSGKLPPRKKSAG
jgi:hypothetical protein